MEKSIEMDFIKSNNSFVGQYSISKTLRFELIPQGKTKELLLKYKEENEDNPIFIDKKRADEYQNMKLILDDYYRYFIEQVLSENIIPAVEIENAYDLYCNRKKSDDDNNAYKNVQKNLRKELSEVFKKKLKDFNLDEYKKLINGAKKEDSRLLQWLQNECENGKQTKEYYDNAEISVRAYNKFSAFFTGFKSNRENLFVAEDKATAIPYRIIHENMEKFFENIKKFKNVKDTYADLYMEIKDFETNFTPNCYNQFFNQRGIDTYNQIIGRKSDSINEKGINQYINEYRQKHNIKNVKLPLMAKLFKQLLSKDDSAPYISQIENDNELFSLIEKMNDSFEKNEYITRLKKCLVKYLSIENASYLYIKSDALTTLSQKLFGDWSLIKTMLQNYAETRFKTKAERNAWIKGNNSIISVALLQNVVDDYCAMAQINSVNICEFYRTFGEVDYCAQIKTNYEKVAEIIKMGVIDNDRSLPSTDGAKGGQGFEQIAGIKAYFDTLLDVLHHISPFILVKNGETLDTPDKDEDFYNELYEIREGLSTGIELYNKVRNYLTRKPYSKNKFKLCFDKDTLLDGWDVSKEKDNLSVLFKKDGQYYLGIMSKRANKLFDYLKNADREQEITPSENEQYKQQFYEKVEYKLLPDPSKMLPKVFFAENNSKLYAPSEDIQNIRKNGLYKKETNDKISLIKWIDFCKESIAKHPEWNKYFKFDFKATSEYNNVSDFYKDVADQGYSLTFKQIKESYIHEKVEQGELYLFRIYSKDFSEHSRGKPNLHTMYWKLLFDESNLKNLSNTKERLIKLNGEAEIFLREASLDYEVTHQKDIPIVNKRQNSKKTYSNFDFDIVKDKRFTQDKFFFHCPITINFRAGSIGKNAFNEKVNQLIEGNENINIIGIDRGERHLLYYTLINQKGEILEQGSLNQITNNYKNGDTEIEVITDYHSILDQKEVERTKARKAWSTVENIKEIKSGYLSQVVHKLAQLMIEKNAIVVLENLNAGFKRGRIKIEKQVYQNFEKALIDKLNYLVFKENSEGENGHYLRGYQLAAPFESFERLGSQTGLLYYVWPSYTSKICPITGFVDLLKPKYENISQAKTFFKKFESIKYNTSGDYFEFDFDYKNFTEKASKKLRWTVCSFGTERYYYSKKDMKYNVYNVTAELKKLFDNNEIKWQDGENTCTAICDKNDAGFFSTLVFYLRLILQMRNTYKNSGDEEDFILSPVIDKYGEFFDSRKVGKEKPQNADANGAYHIALKGLNLIKSIKDGIIEKKKSTDKDWFDFVQNR